MDEDVKDRCALQAAAGISEQACSDKHSYNNDLIYSRTS